MSSRAGGTAPSSVARTFSEPLYKTQFTSRADELSNIVNDFFAHEFAGHDIARRVAAESVVGGCAVFRMDGPAPARGCDGIAPYLPRFWTCKIAPYSDLSAADNTGTRNVLWVSVPLEHVAWHPMWSEVYWAVALGVVLLALVATFLYRFFYIY